MDVPPFLNCDFSASFFPLFFLFRFLSFSTFSNLAPSFFARGGDINKMVTQATTAVCATMVWQPCRSSRPSVQAVMAEMCNFRKVIRVRVWPLSRIVTAWQPYQCQKPAVYVFGFRDKVGPGWWTEKELTSKVLQRNVQHSSTDDFGDIDKLASITEHVGAVPPSGVWQAPTLYILAKKTREFQCCTGLEVLLYMFGVSGGNQRERDLYFPTV